MFGDNAAMIGWALIEKIKTGIKPDLNFKANPRLSIFDSLK
jgi:Metal-dependent proteases with possible chaperone activity